MITPQNARKEMFALVNSVWSSKSGAIVGYVPEVRYKGVEVGKLPGASKFWMYAQTIPVTTQNNGHRTADEPGQSQVVYLTYGIVMLTIYAPMTSPTAWDKGELLSELGQCIFMASETPGGVWFRRPRIVEMTNDGTWFRWQVLADYQFNHVKGI